MTDHPVPLLVMEPQGTQGLDEVDRLSPLKTPLVGAQPHYRLRHRCCAYVKWSLTIFRDCKVERQTRGQADHQGLQNNSLVKGYLQVLNGGYRSPPKKGKSMCCRAPLIVWDFGVGLSTYKATSTPESVKTLRTN